MASFSSRRVRSVLITRLLAPAAVFAVLLTSGCHQAVTDPADPKFVVAEKGDWKITNSQLDGEVNTYLQQNHATPDQIGPQRMPMLRAAILDNIILKKLILDKAAVLQPKDTDKEEAAELDHLKGPATDDEFAKQLTAAGFTLDELKKRIHEKVLIGKVLQAEAFTNTEPTEAEIDDIYLKNKERFNIPAKVRASRILFHVDDKTPAPQVAAQKKAAEAARARVTKGEDFSKVAMEVSEDQSSKDKGGDLGYFQKGENESDSFDDVAFNTKVGVVSPIFQTPLGFQFLKVTDSTPAGVVPIADARAFIAGKLRQAKMGEEQEAYGKKLLAESGVVYHLPKVEAPPVAPGSPDAAPAGPGDMTPQAPGTPAAASASGDTTPQPPTTPPAGQ